MRLKCGCLAHGKYSPVVYCENAPQKVKAHEWYNCPVTFVPRCREKIRYPQGFLECAVVRPVTRRLDVSCARHFQVEVALGGILEEGEG